MSRSRRERFYMFPFSVNPTLLHIQQIRSDITLYWDLDVFITRQGSNTIVITNQHGVKDVHIISEISTCQHQFHKIENYLFAIFTNYQIEIHKYLIGSKDPLKLIDKIEIPLFSARSVKRTTRQNIISPSYQINRIQEFPIVGKYLLIITVPNNSDSIYKIDIFDLIKMKMIRSLDPINHTNVKRTNIYGNEFGFTIDYLSYTFHQ